MTLDELIDYTENFVTDWQNVHGFAPKDTADAMDKVILKNILDMTKTLSIWFDKNELSDGEKILAAINIGALAEAWLRILLIIWLRDYNNSQYKTKKYDCLTFEKVIDFYKKENVLYRTDPNIFTWLDDIRRSRNTVHLCSENKIYNDFDLIKDFNLLCDLVDNISDQIPPMPSDGYF